MAHNFPNLLEQLRAKFPDMTPVKRAPWLGTVNGFGLSLFGKRNVDKETDTYVKTRCLCALFLPLFAVGAYRVGDAGDRQWFFFGKQPLSRFARLWNGAFVSAVVLFGSHLGWQAYLTSPSHLARVELTQAAELAGKGQTAKAAEIYRKLLVGGQPFANESRAGLKSTLEQCLQSDSPQPVQAAFRILAGLPSTINQPTPVIPDATGRGLSLVEKFRAKDPEEGLQIFEQVSRLEPKRTNFADLRVTLLKEAVAAHPTDTNRVIELALFYEAHDQLDTSAKLLLPCQQKLGASEGARILGQYLLRGGKHHEAYDLLYPYVQSQLQRLHVIERNYTNTLAAVQRRALNDLNQHRAPASFYSSYHSASKTEKDAMVDEYIEKQVQSDPGFKRALAEFAAAGKIVHVTLDLGIVQLNRAQEQKDPAARKAELEAAEKTFLAIRGLAGETDEYRMFLGQVYYWLGRSEEGKQLFDKLLAARKRSYRILMTLAETLRDVGEEPQARALLEEAYAKGSSDKEKFAAASYRSHMHKDTDDQIAWLEKSDSSEPYVQISLNSARGNKALQQGNKEVAARYLREAIAGHQRQTKTTATLNNCGLDYFNLYQATGNIDDHNRGLGLIEEAITLDPGNSILLMNTVHVLLSQAVIGIVRDSIHLEALRESPTTALLSHMYEDERGRKEVYQNLHQTESMKKALGYLDKALLLAPKNLRLYEIALHLQSAFEDAAELRKLQQRFAIAKPDLDEERKDMLTALSGARDKEFLGRFQARIRVLDELANSPAVRDHPLTAEHVSVSLCELRQNAAIYGGQADSRNLLAEAMRARDKHLSGASQAAVISAYFFAAHNELSQLSPEYADLAKRTRRAVSPDFLVALVLEQGGQLAEMARKNSNVSAALELSKDEWRRFGSFPRGHTWALFRRVYPEEATLLAASFKTNEVAQLDCELAYEIDPMSGTSALERYWTYRMIGDDKQASDVYELAIRQGLPLPPRGSIVHSAAK